MDLLPFPVEVFGRKNFVEEHQVIFFHFNIGTK